MGQGEKLRRPGLLGAKLGEHKSRTGRTTVSEPPVSVGRVATEWEASQQRQMQPVEIQLRVNDAWWG